jgi:flagellar assembly protein FliH
MSSPSRGSAKPVSAYQRWELASFDPPPPAPVHAPDYAAAAAAELAAELQRVRDAAQAEGFAAGQAEGQARGYQDGHTRGEAAGFAAGLSAVQEQAQRLAALSESVQQALDQVTETLSEDIAALALDIARQVIRQQVRHDPAAVAAVAREVLATEPALSGAPQLLVHPDDLPVAQAYLQEQLDTLGWTLRGDASLEPGGCRASAASGEIDASLATRWERVAAALGKECPW